MGFATQDFLLQTKTAIRLYEVHAQPQPILDYHCHLSPQDIADDRRFRNLFEICLEGDHYKWRAMRANGVPERYCTGDADPYEKFLAWAKTVPSTLRNVEYQWSHLELQRYFGIQTLLDETSAPAIWEQANEQLNTGDLSAQGILKKFDVHALCTTDDPTDSLESHNKIRDSKFQVLVFPTFRPDNALRTQDSISFNRWTGKLAASANVEIAGLDDFLSALRLRHDYFHECGCRLSDHGLDYCYSEPCTLREAKSIFKIVRTGNNVDSSLSAKFASFLMLFFASLDAEKGWTKQLHLGAYRNANTRMLRLLGRDVGFDSIGDWPQVQSLATFLDRLNSDRILPKIIVYNANPKDNYVFATMIGNFQDGTVPGKLQFGSGWWFLDQKEGVEWQLNALSNCGLLARFVGMVTDSRSFMSYPRHEYFRRILCNLLGGEMESGHLPNDQGLIGRMIEDICFNNAAAYLELPGVHPNRNDSGVHSDPFVGQQAMKRSDVSTLLNPRSVKTNLQRPLSDMSKHMNSRRPGNRQGRGIRSDEKR
jgi:glucuronate isomerase